MQSNKQKLSAIRQRGSWFHGVDGGVPWFGLALCKQMVVTSERLNQSILITFLLWGETVVVSQLKLSGGRSCYVRDTICPSLLPILLLQLGVSRLLDIYRCWDSGGGGRETMVDRMNVTTYRSLVVWVGWRLGWIVIVVSLRATKPEE